MRDLTEEELEQWAAVTMTVAPIGCTFKSSRRVPVRITLAPERSWVLDLHDNTLEEAYRAVSAMICDARDHNQACVTIITGKSGQICREFPMWVERLPVRNIEMLSGGGAFRLGLRR